MCACVHVNIYICVSVCVCICIIDIDYKLVMVQIFTCLKSSCNFPREKPNELMDQQDMFCFNHTSASYTSNNIEENVD